MVDEHHGGHEFELGGVCVAAGLAGLVVGYPRHFPTTRDGKIVRDASEPYVFVKESTRRKVSSDTHLFFAPDVGVEGSERFHECAVRLKSCRECNPVFDEVLKGFMYCCSIEGSFGVFRFEVFENTDLVVPPGAALKVFDCGIGMCECHGNNWELICQLPV